MEFAVAVFAGLIGGLIGILAQTLVFVKNSELAAISDQIDEVRRIETLATQYWLTPPSDDQECIQLASRLRGAIMASSNFEEIGPKILGCRFSKYVDLTLELDDVVTGGRFEEAERPIDPTRVVATMRVCGELVAHLRVCRKYVFLYR